MIATTTPRAPSVDHRFPPAPWLFAGGVVLLVAVLLLGAHLKSVTGPLRTDAVAARELQQHGATGRAERSKFQQIADVGSEIPVLVSVVILAAWAATRRDWRGVGVAIVAPSTALVLTEYVLKPPVDRTSPKGALEYPSGHTTVVAALATTAVLFVYRYVGPRAALLWSPYAVAIIGAVAVAVVALLGVGVVLVMAGAADSVSSRPRIRT